jgi:sugar lactone lactonase YvrE
MRLHPKSGWITLILTLGTINLPAEYVWKNFVGLPGGSGNVDGPVSTARFYNPSGITIDNTGQIYIADQLNHAIRKISISGQVTTLAGSSGLQGSVNGIGAAAMFSNPSALVSDPSGNIYVADDFNHTIRKITPSGVVTTFAGLAGHMGSADGPANDARFKRPFAIARGSDGTLYVTEFDNHTIRKIAADGTVSTLAGSAGQAGTVDDNGSAARFDTPSGIAVTSDGHVYVSDSGNHTLRKITPSGDVTTLAGSAGIFAFADGTGTEARFHNPQGLALSPSGQLYVADAQNGRIRVVNPAGVVTTLAGGHSSRSADGIGSAAGFYVPSSICLEANEIGRAHV